MKLEVMMFAGAKELLGDAPKSEGAHSVMVELPLDATAQDVMDQLAALHPGLVSLLPSCRLAVNDQYVANDFQINADQEVALIPPVSGG